MTERDLSIELFRGWVEALLSTLEIQMDDDARADLIESCGRACALQYNAVEQARAIQRSTTEFDERLERVNQEILWCGSWTREADTLTSVCEECGCPLVRASLVRLSPTFCYCSRGWVKAVFEAVLDTPVEVELAQAIGRGDPACRFVVHLKPAASASISQSCIPGAA
jgi:predicted ArsR family transcriptional regulator